jgi:GNAT superfamily N-acetyltransferase
MNRDLISLADEHTRAVQAWLSSRSPNQARLDLSNATATSTGLQIQFLNLALSRAGELAQLDGEIETVKAFFARRGVPWYWMIGALPERETIQQRLKAHGLTYNRPDLPAMAAPLPAPKVEIPPDIQVWQAASVDDLKWASKIRHAAFRFPQGVATTYFEDMPDDWLKNPNARLFLARLGDSPPASIGALIVGAGYPGVYVMATLPEWERRGLGRAILNRILAEAAAMGFPLIVLTASKKGYPLYQKFGFEHLFDYIFYEPGKK